ncbi:hypothetical protein TL16_g10317 [Triparma laevis f. inornata]|uniref:Uncharacterized protein n=1 Tax=Triparma laevis f. inornata TaxID=1714386 RepID=A0A9W7BFC9_9STRA|nr:hypothetical protein TL16_g10317 [Triparma laevis f. inornata]
MPSSVLGYYTAPDSEKLPDPSGNVSTFSLTPKPTVGVEFATKIILHPTTGARIKAQIWDTAGQERYRAITNSHYRRAAGALLVYDVSERSSFGNLSSWIKNLRDTAESNSNILNCVSIVGNKCDKPSLVSMLEHSEVTSKFGLTLSARTSAKTGEGIQKAFEELVVKVYESDPARGRKNGGRGISLKKVGSGDNSSGGCC